MARRLNSQSVLAVLADVMVRLCVPSHVDREALPCELIDDGVHTELVTISRAVLNEVVSPDMVGVFWLEPDTRPIVKPQPAALRFSAGHADPLAARSEQHACD